MILLTSILSITLSMVLYSIATWRNHRAKRLEATQLYYFWGGVVLDLVGTRMMGMLVEGETTWDFHTISGYTGLGLMIALVALGTCSYRVSEELVLRNFHRFAVPIWMFWMCSYISGIVVGMQRH